MAMIISFFMLMAAPAQAGPAAGDILTAAAEDSMALGAAPEQLRAGAGIYRLGPSRYEQVRPSSNGFNCLVARDSDHGRSPTCYDSEGAATVMGADLLRGELIRQGRDDRTIDAEIERRFSDGRLTAPRRAGVAYMLSHDFSRYNEALGRRECVYPPHVMIYAPYRTNADIGNGPDARGSMTRPWILNEGKANAYIIVAMTHDRGESCR